MSTDTDKLVGFLLALGGLMLFLPGIRTTSVEWLLEYDIAAPAGAGILTVPWLEVDLTGRAILLLALALVLLAGAGRLLAGVGSKVQDGKES